MIRSNGNPDDFHALPIAPAKDGKTGPPELLKQLLHWPPSWLMPVRQDRRNRTGGVYQEYFLRFTQDIKARGVVQPIIAVGKGDVGEVVDGETRRLAALVAGLSTVPVLLYEVDLSESDLIIAQLQANEMRLGFSDLERAEVYAKLMQLNRWSQGQLAKFIQASPGQVSRVLCISSKLPDDLKALIGEGTGKIPPSAAYHLSKLPTVEMMRALGDQVVQGLLTRDCLEGEVAMRLGKRSAKGGKPVKLTLGGVTLAIRESDVDQVRAALALLDAALKKLQKHQLPLSSLPDLLQP